MAYSNKGAAQHSAKDLNQVLLFGELLADIFPDRTVIGGAPFNVARHLQAFGLHPLLFSRIGDDALGATFTESLNDFSLDTRGIQVDPLNPTGKVRVHIKDGGHGFAILPDQAYDFINAEKLRQLAAGLSPKLLYFGTLAQRGTASKHALQTLLDVVKAPRMVDLNLRKPWFDWITLRSTLETADILKLNMEELETLADLFNLQGKHPQAKTENLINRFTIKTVLLTDGAAGAWLLNDDDTQAQVVGTPSTEIIDTVGAGDAFASVFILGMIAGWPDSFILERADEFARAICGIRGAVPMEQAFYEPFLRDWQML